MAYVPDPDDATMPVLDTKAGTAQAEFVKIKEKMNNLFLMSDYKPTLLEQPLKAGLSYIGVLPSGNTDPGIMYGHAINITRNDISGSGAQVVAAQLTAIFGDNLDGVAKNISVFGAATEAWTGKVASHATLIGLESSIIAQYNDNAAALVGFDVVFKNRNDASAAGLTNAGNFIAGGTYIINTVGTTDFVAIGASANTAGVIFTATGVGAGTGTATGSVFQGHGANKYNTFSRAIQITAQPRSGSGESCGWATGIIFQPGCIDYSNISGVQTPGVAINIAAMGSNPSTTEPWTAHPICSAVALSEYQSITWDYLKYARSYLDSANTRMVFLGVGNYPTTNPLFAYNYDTNNMELPAMLVGGVPGAATASMRIKVGGNNYLIALTPA